VAASATTPPPPAPARAAAGGDERAGEPQPSAPALSCRATGQTPGIAAAAIRTLLRIIDGLFSYAVAFIVVLTSGKRQRLGDMAAHTLVVRN
jgi:hypothetical protein